MVVVALEVESALETLVKELAETLQQYRCGDGCRSLKCGFLHCFAGLLVNLRGCR